MKVYLGADHRGYDLKEKVKVWLAELGVEVEDRGAFEYLPEDDYVDYAVSVVKAMEEGEKGILLCGSGHGMDMTANRFAKVRAIMGFREEVVKQGREHENANILVIPAEWVSEQECKQMIKVFLETKFSGKDKYKRRVGKLGELGNIGDE